MSRRRARCRSGRAPPCVAGAIRPPDPITFTMPQRSQLEVCLRDPDGVLINLIDRDQAEQFRTSTV
jgi:hypothetical protein